VTDQILWMMWRSVVINDVNIVGCDDGKKWINNQDIRKEDIFGNSLFFLSRSNIIFVRWCVLSNEASSLGDGNKLELRKVELKEVELQKWRTLKGRTYKKVSQKVCLRGSNKKVEWKVWENKQWHIERVGKSAWCIFVNLYRLILVRSYS